MANPFFKFKQFTIFQDQCAMKVCTDACIFGASIEVKDAKRILDIGTGTGLLSLMLAQRSEAEIVAVEIDENAFHQAKFNIEQSPWGSKISLFHTDIQTFSKNSDEKFDLVVSNPPFFQNHLKSYTNSKNKAKHNDTLTLEELASSINAVLSGNGEAIILLPEIEAGLFETILKEYSITKTHSILIYQKKNSKIFRVINNFVTIQV